MQKVNEGPNFEAFRDALSTTVIVLLAPNPSKKKRAVKGRKREIKHVTQAAESMNGDLNDAAELSDFVEYLAQETFPSLPADLRTLSYAGVQEDPPLAEKYGLPLDSDLLHTILEHVPLAVSDSLSAYGLISPTLANLDRFVEPVLTSYVEAATTAPPEYTPALSASRPDGCEICGREHLPLTYHHLIPRQMHEKAVKRGWHRPWELGKVAWLCRACHSFVHRTLTNEELARDWFEIDKLIEREDVRKWADWVGRIRWKAQ